VKQPEERYRNIYSISRTVGVIKGFIQSPEKSLREYPFLITIKWKKGLKVPFYLESKAQLNC